MLDTRAIGPLVHARLAELRATSTAELLGSGPRRALGHGALAVLPHSNGRGGYVLIVIEPGSLPVATEIGLRMSITVDDTGTTAIRESPTREDLATAVRLALDGEDRAFQAATRALEAAGHRSPSTWAKALRTIRLDPRLPAGQFVGAPTWQLLFDPWDEARGGFHHVLLSVPGFAVLDVR